MDINEFRTTWNNELFQKHKSAVGTARRLIRKSLVIAQIRSCRQLKYIENDLVKELQAAEDNRQLVKNSLADGLQNRLKVLQTEILHYNNQMKTLVQKEKHYWKELEQTIAKRANLREPPTHKLASTPSNIHPVVFVMHVDQNNENLPPLKSTSPVKIPKIRKKKKCPS